MQIAAAAWGPGAHSKQGNAGQAQACNKAVSRKRLLVMARGSPRCNIGLGHPDLWSNAALYSL